MNIPMHGPARETASPRASGPTGETPPVAAWSDDRIIALMVWYHDIAPPSAPE